MTKPQLSIEGANTHQGLSRAAKKRAKKKNPKPQQESKARSGSSNNSNSILPFTKKQKKTKEETSKAPSQHDWDQHDSDDDHDEMIEMKNPALSTIDTAEPPPNDLTTTTTTTCLMTDDCDKIPLVQHVKGCHSLSEIVMGSNNEKEETPFPQLMSRQRSYCALQFLLQDVSVIDFYKKYWEKEPLLVKVDGSNQTRHRFDGFLSLKSIEEWTQKSSVYYTKDLNVTRYCPQKQRRITLDKQTKNDNGGDSDPVAVDATELWSMFHQQGCTIRLLGPHNGPSPSLHALLSLLELEWGCMVGANAYLTPPGGSQGFAPHYDDIEAFILQLEGQKRWKVYKPPATDILPRYSSADFVPKDLGPNVLDVMLEPGDLLYLPRGWIHQACTLPKEQGEHSLHVTVSCQQQWAWADLLEIVVPEALESSIQSATDSSLRQGLPLRFLNYMGAMYDDRDVPAILQRKVQSIELSNDDSGYGNKQRLLLQETFRTEAKKRILRVAQEAMTLLDAACDEMGKRFLSDRLPPALTDSERKWTNQNERTNTKLLPSHACRLVRPGIARLVLENKMAVLYHCADNSLVFREHPLSPMEFELDDGPALEQLLTSNDWVLVQDLIHDTIEDKIGLAQALYDEGILAVKY